MMSSTSVLRRACIKASFSPKINWVVQQIRDSPDDKFLVFSANRNGIYWLAETLDVAGISYMLLVSEGIDIQKRLQYIEKFKTDPLERVLIVDIALGSRGLSLTAANRVIFLEPIWQPDQEAQAKKRAHRIGQQRPVTVDILVMRGAFEDRLLARRQSLRAEDFRGLESPQDDSELRNLLQSAPFLEEVVTEDSAGSNLNTPWFDDVLLPRYASRVRDRPGGHVTPSHGISELMTPVSPDVHREMAISDVVDAPSHAVAVPALNVPIGLGLSMPEHSPQLSVANQQRRLKRDHNSYAAHSPAGKKRKVSFA